MKTIKSFSMNFLACAMAVLAASAGTAGAALTEPKINPGSGFVAAGTGTACNVDTPPVISVTSTGNAAVWVNFRYKGATWRLPMTNGVTPFCLKMPVIPAGTVEYRPDGHGAAEVGYAVHPAFRDNGVAVRALELALDQGCRRGRSGSGFGGEGRGGGRRKQRGEQIGISFHG